MAHGHMGVLDQRTPIGILLDLLPHGLVAQACSEFEYSGWTA